MLPDAHDRPAGRLQRVVIATIPLDVAIELCLPIRRVHARAHSVGWAAVPEAAIDEDRQPGRREDNVSSASHARVGRRFLKKRSPRAWRAERKARSGLVSELRFATMTARALSELAAGAGGSRECTLRLDPEDFGVIPTP